MKKLFILLLFIIGCSEDPTSVETDDTSDRVHGTIHGIVSDENTNTRLSGIIVKYLKDDSIDTTVTDTDGYYVITNLQPGDYVISFIDISLAYTVIKQVVTIDKLDVLVAGNQYAVDTGDDHYITVDKDVSMYKLNAGVTGTVYLKQDDNNTVTSANITVTAEYSEDIYPNEYQTVTNSSGIYTFENIPSTSSAIIKTRLHNIGNYTYTSGYETVLLVPNVVVAVDNIIIEKTSFSPILLWNNFEQDGFHLWEKIQGTFNEAINITANNFQVSITGGAIDDNYTVEWNDNNKSFKIIPNSYLYCGTGYSITISGETVLGMFFTYSGSFTTEDCS